MGASSRVDAIACNVEGICSGDEGFEANALRIRLGVGIAEGAFSWMAADREARAAIGLVMGRR
jgi:hypothetical protein